MEELTDSQWELISPLLLLIVIISFNDISRIVSGDSAFGG